MHLGKFLVEGPDDTDIFVNKTLSISTRVEGGRRILHIGMKVVYETIVTLNGRPLVAFDTHDHSPSNIGREMEDLPEEVKGKISTIIWAAPDMLNSAKGICLLFEIPADGGDIHVAAGLNDIQLLLVTSLTDKERLLVAGLRGNLGNAIQNFRTTFGASGDKIFVNTLRASLLSNSIKTAAR